MEQTFVFNANERRFSWVYRYPLKSRQFVAVILRTIQNASIFSVSRLTVNVWKLCTHVTGLIHARSGFPFSISGEYYLGWIALCIMSFSWITATASLMSIASFMNFSRGRGLEVSTGTKCSNVRMLPCSLCTLATLGQPTEVSTSHCQLPAPFAPNLRQHQRQ